MREPDTQSLPLIKDYQQARAEVERLRGRLVAERRTAAILAALNARDTADAWRRASAWVAETHGAEFGVEHVELADGTELGYVNRGEVYDETVCHTDARGFFLSSWGDEVEASERARAEEAGEERCPYCGAWFDLAEVDDRGRTPCCGAWCTRCSCYPCGCEGARR